MTAFAKSGTFVLNNAVGNQVITGLGFQPKLVIFCGQFMGTVSGGQQLRRTFGAAASNTAQFAMCWSFSENPDLHDQQFVTSRCIKWNDAASDVEQISADFVSMDPDGFTIHVDAGTLSPTINFFAVGGTDVSAAVGGFNSSTVNGASQAITGIGFKPNLVILGKGPFETAGLAVGECHSMIGIADSTGVQECSGMYLQGNTPPPVLSFQRTDKVVAMVDNTSAFNQTADMTSYDAGGFTLTWNLAYGTSGSIGYIALGGAAKFRAFAINAPAATGNQVITGAGFTPVGHMFFTNGFPASNTLVRTNSYNGIGSADGTHQNSVGSYLVDSSTSTAAPYGTQDSTSCVHSPDGTGAARDSGSFTSNDSDGFTINWTKVTGSSDQIIGFTVGTSTLTVLTTGVAATGKVGTVTASAKATVTLTDNLMTEALSALTTENGDNISTSNPVLTAGAGSVGATTITTPTGWYVSTSLVGTGQVGTVSISGGVTAAVTGVAASALLGSIVIPPPTYGVTLSGLGMTMANPASPVVEIVTFGPPAVAPSSWTNVQPP